MATMRPYQGVMEEIMKMANTPTNGSKKCVGGGGFIPPIFLQEAKVPKFYRDVIAICGATSERSPPNTALVYNLMAKSGLPPNLLSYIFNAASRKHRGQLDRTEFYTLLALIALAQKDFSLVEISTMNQLPIPFLEGHTAAPNQEGAVKSKSGKVLPKATFGLPYVFNKDQTSQGNAAQQSSATDQGSILDFREDNAVEIDTRMEKELQAVWPLLITEACNILEEADQVWIQAIDVLKEVAVTERGHNYLTALSKVSAILKRLNCPNRDFLPHDLRQRAEKATRIWERLENFHRLVIIDAPDTNYEKEKCSICLSSITMNNSEPFEGHIYHRECANLWFDRVHQKLPKLYTQKH
ncbi:unnamed protein product, partial [Mesorhabditis spiculigera]